MRFFRGHTCSHHNESSQQVKLFPIPQLRLASSSLDTGTGEGSSRSQTGKQRLAEVIYPGRAERRMGGKHPSLRAAVGSIQSNSNFLPVPLVWTGLHTLQRYAYWEYKPGGQGWGVGDKQGPWELSSQIGSSSILQIRNEGCGQPQAQSRLLFPSSWIAVWVAESC